MEPTYNNQVETQELELSKEFTKPDDENEIVKEINDHIKLLPADGG